MVVSLIGQDGHLVLVRVASWNVTVVARTQNPPTVGKSVLNCPSSCASVDPAQVYRSP